MADILDFSKKLKQKRGDDFIDLLDLNMTVNSEGEYEVFLTINDDYTDAEIFDALVAAAVKFATDRDLVEVEEENE